MNDNLKLLPPEVLETILNYCDYNTLKNAKDVNCAWNRIADYLIKQCRQEIPLRKFDSFKTAWNGTLELCELYDNWKYWKNMEENISFTNGVFFSLQEVKDLDENISHISVGGKCIAIAFERIVRVYDHNSTFIREFKFDNLNEIEAIHLVSDDQSEEPPALLTAFECDVFISDISAIYDHGIFKYYQGFSAFRQYFCGIYNSILMIAAVCSDDCTRKMSYNLELSLPADYNDDACVSTTMTSTECIIMVDNNVKIVYYKTSNSSYGHIIDLAQLHLAINYNSILGIFRTWIFENIIFLLYWGFRTDEQILEIFHLGNNAVLKSTKMFRPYDTFEEEINSIWLHGSTLLLCFMSGKILFYEVSDWTVFDINKYSKRVDLPKIQPIHGVKVTEFHKKRIFYIAGTQYIYYIHGVSTNTNINPGTLFYFKQ
ncbi:uncharacterized protein [Atheta coriaria]|uniref:uncharacterized protein isoform X2 n=1 Tax=Dalotia coriaria TaxID=877792 RepID=UPI0031F3F05B